MNDFSKGTKVGTFTITKSSTGTVTVTYKLFDGFDLGSVHVWASCSQPDTCAPGQYTYVNDSAFGGVETTFSVDFSGLCSCSTIYFIIHADINCN